jgi:hypothetical protein
MIETDFGKIEQLANDLHKAGHKWHFHMLTPGCIFNQSKKHTFILEDTDGKKIYAAYSDKRNMVLGQKLVKIIHGNGVLEKSDSPVKNPTMKSVIGQAKKLNGKNIPWHHHLLFPDCIFNDHKGMWNIVFEDQGKITEVVYEKEPKEDLRQIEILYYAQKK